MEVVGKTTLEAVRAPSTGATEDDRGACVTGCTTAGPLLSPALTQSSRKTKLLSKVLKKTKDRCFPYFIRFPHFQKIQSTLDLGGGGSGARGGICVYS